MDVEACAGVRVSATTVSGYRRAQVGHSQCKKVLNVLPSRPCFARLSCHQGRPCGSITPTLRPSGQVVGDFGWIVAARLDLAIVEQWDDEGTSIIGKED